MIYVLTRGIYSDYHIIVATQNYELAKQLKEKYDKYLVEQFGEYINLCNIEEYREDIVEMYLKYDNYNVKFKDYMKGDIESIVKFPISERKWEDYRPFHIYNDGSAEVIVVAKDLESAAKIANERRIEFFVRNNL